MLLWHPVRLSIFGGQRWGREKEMRGTWCFLWLCWLTLAGRVYRIITGIQVCCLERVLRDYSWCFLQHVRVKQQTSGRAFERNILSAQLLVGKGQVNILEEKNLTACGHQGTQQWSTQDFSQYLWHSGNSCPFFHPSCHCDRLPSFCPGEQTFSFWVLVLVELILESSKLEGETVGARACSGG